MSIQAIESAGNAEVVNRPLVKNVTLLINPVSCPRGVEARTAEIMPILEERGMSAQVYETCAPEGALPQAQRAIERGTDLIAVVGGDGTVMEAMNALIGTSIPIAILPAGTGNVLALNLGIPSDIPSALGVALDGIPRPIDLVEVDMRPISSPLSGGALDTANGTKYFAIMGGVGYDARIMKETPREAKQKIGRFAYLWTAIKNVGEDRFAVSISIDGQRAVRSRAKSVLVANMGEILPKIRVFPEARPDDGVIEVGVIKAARRRSLLRLVFRALVGRPEDDPAFDAYQARSIVLEMRRPQPLQLDGDVIADVTRLKLTVAPGAVRIMLPRPDEAV